MLTPAAMRTWAVSFCPAVLPVPLAGGHEHGQRPKPLIGASREQLPAALMSEHAEIVTPYAARAQTAAASSSTQGVVPAASDSKRVPSITSGFQAIRGVPKRPVTVPVAVTRLQTCFAIPMVTRRVISEKRGVNAARGTLPEFIPCQLARPAATRVKTHAPL